ncbi:MAG: hypothetical protein AAGH15_25405 [Myxococcota bacterium]
MSTVLLAFAFVLLVGLLLADAVGLRELEEERPLAGPVSGAPRWPLRLIAALTSLFGAVGFPATLAPVILTVLVAQEHPFVGDGWTSLVAILVAALSMSAAVKCFRLASMMLERPGPDEGATRRTAFWLGGWNALVVALLALAKRPLGVVTPLVWGYALASVAVFALAVAGIRLALAHQRQPAPKPLA